MAKGENRMMRRRIVNAYASSIVSISLVLLLIGVAALLIINAGSVSRYFKENLQVSVLLKQDVTEAQAAKYGEKLSALPYIRETRLVTREQGTEELKAMLGEDFLSVFETSPVPVSLDLSLHADYVSADSLAKIIPVLEASELVDEVNCQTSLVDALNANLARISLVLGVFILLMLFISFVLINNTVRINVFSRRFTIHTMKLVGATKGFIRGPFLVRAVLQGLISAALASGLMALGLHFVKKSFPELFTVFTTQMQLMVYAIIVVCGVILCVVSTYFVVGKLVSMSKDELYY